MKKNKGEVRINLYLNYYDAAVLDAILRLIQHEKANYGESKMPLFFLNSSKDFTRGTLLKHFILYFSKYPEAINHLFNVDDFESYLKEEYEKAYSKSFKKDSS